MNEKEKRPTDPEDFDPFDPEQLTVNQDYTELVGAEELLTYCPCRRPNGQEYIQAHPEICLSVYMVREKDTGYEYLVRPELLPAVEMAGIQLRHVHLYLCVNRQRKYFLWPIPLPPSGESHLRVVDEAKRRWLKPYFENFACHAMTPQVQPEDPTWPDRPIRDYLELAFGSDRMIQTNDHPFLKAMRGEF